MIDQSLVLIRFFGLGGSPGSAGYSSGKPSTMWPDSCHRVPSEIPPKKAVTQSSPPSGIVPASARPVPLRKTTLVAPGPLPSFATTLILIVFPLHAVQALSAPTCTCIQPLSFSFATLSMRVFNLSKRSAVRRSSSFVAGRKLISIVEVTMQFASSNSSAIGIGCVYCGSCVRCTLPLVFVSSFFAVPTSTPTCPGHRSQTSPCQQRPAVVAAIDDFDLAATTCSAAASASRSKESPGEL